MAVAFCKGHRPREGLYFLLRTDGPGGDRAFRAPTWKTHLDQDPEGVTSWSLGSPCPGSGNKKSKRLLDSEMLCLSTQWQARPPRPSLPAVLGPLRTELSRPHHPFPLLLCASGVLHPPVSTEYLNIISIKCGNFLSCYFDLFY